ncbi:hypothetical protein [Aquimarina pacifica]|uniref:hypothetical protein n=1 Tax=Aquimarina pacifica TaxID=1296415 RepID=UPI000470ECC7|nr:hypothetical protein [Aquimarina pacifica]
MKTIKLIFFLTSFFILSCQPEHDGISENPEQISLEKEINTAKNYKASLYIKYKKSIWLKKGSAIVMSAKSGRAIVYDLEKYDVVTLKDQLTLWETGVFANSGCDCSPGQICINGICQAVGGGDGLPEQPCGGNCPPGTICIQDTCTEIDPCANCAPDQICINGICQATDPCADCTPDQICINGICTSDPCNECDEDEICIQGECQDIGTEGGAEVLTF